MSADLSDSFFQRFLLPTRALLLSWVQQTAPMRRAMLEDALALLDESRDEGPDVRDMALLGVAGSALQPFEDLALLDHGWNAPRLGLPMYLGSTLWTDRTVNRFWERAHKHDDEYLDVFAGFRGREASTGKAPRVIDGLRPEEPFSPDWIRAHDEAVAATRAVLGRLLPQLADIWKRWRPYFHAYKHGGLIISRDGSTWREDDGSPMDQPMLQVWRRRSSEPAAMTGDPDEIATQLSARGRQAIGMCERFVHSRLAAVDVFEVRGDGSIGLRPAHLRWGNWLEPDDLSEETWRLIGRAGPTMEWIGTPEGESHLAVDPEDLARWWRAQASQEYLDA